MATTNPTPALAHLDAIRIAANAVARFEYETSLDDLHPTQQRICEGVAAAAIGAYLSAVKREVEA
jgi:hypothetical protein